MKQAIIIGTILVLILIPLAQADVIVFDSYDTTMSYNNGKLLVTKHLRLKNVGDTPIIPGEVHFKISQEQKNNEVAPQVDKFSVTNKLDKSLETRQVTSNGEVDLVFTVWDPLLPDFFYDLTMTYEISFHPRGILFYQVNLPEEKTTIPIEEATTTFVLPKQYHVTYLSPQGTVGNEDGGTSVQWSTKDSYNVEYSLIPFPRLGFKAVNVFWVIIILLFLINLFLRMKKKAQMV